jgi:RND family efflux transporter MFP subunit
MSIATCPSREELMNYVVGKLDDDASDALANHLDSCPDCQAELATLPDPDDTLIARLRGPIPPDPFWEEPGCDRAVARAMTIMENEAAATDLPRQLGEYQLIERLGSGGMGTVYKARQGRLERIVALKILSGGRTGNPRAIVRFEREMKAIGQLDHPNIVRAYDAREIDGTLVLIMELVDGLDLAEIVRRCGPLAVPEACELVRQTAVALQCAHEHGLVHRDIKPSNVMLARSGITQSGLAPSCEVKLLDLGLARFYAEGVSPGAAGAAGEETTGTGQAMGTADYMAPEQATDSRAVDIRADIYSLGCTLYKLLTGRAPFSGPEYRTALDKMNAHVHRPPPPVRQFASQAPEGLCTTLDRMLAKNPDDRFATPAEVAESLVPWSAGADLPALLQRAREADLSPLPPAVLSRMGAGQGEGFGIGEGRSSTPQTAPRPPLLLTSWGWKWFTGQLLLLAMAGGLGFALGIMIHIHKDGKQTDLEAPEGSRIRLGANGDVDVDLPHGANAARAALTPPTNEKHVQAPSLPAAPPVVTVSRPVVRDVTDYEDFTGHIEASQTVEIRARVTGNVEKVRVKPGMSVKQGDMLMEIDPRIYQAELDQASIAVKLAKVHLDSRTEELKRDQDLLRSHAMSQGDFDQVKTRQSVAEAALETAAAAVNLARLRLDYTQVAAPFAGNISGPLPGVGSLVTADKTVLATLSSTDPMYVVFDIDERIAGAIRRKDNAKPGFALSLPVVCGLPDNEGFTYRAKMDSVESRVDPASGTVRIRAVLSNKDGILMPNMFVRVRLTTSDPYKALLVPEKALGSDQGRKFVFVVNDQNVVEHRDVKVRQMTDDELRVVTEGLKAEDRVITSGLQLVRAGMTVTIKPDRAATPGRSPSQQQAVSEVEKIAHEVTFEDNDPTKPVIGVNLDETRMTNAVLERLAGFSELQTLSMIYTTVTNSGLEHLKGLRKLRSLNLSISRGVTDAGLAHLAGLTELRTLKLNSTGITDAGLAHLRGLTKLESLGLGPKVTDAGLAQLKGMTSLQEVDLDYAGITDAGLVQLKGLTNLQTLGLPDKITDAGLEQLKGLTELRKLRLGGRMDSIVASGVTDAGLEHLKGLTKLESLTLGAGITDAGLEHLNALPNLKELYLTGASITDAGLARLKGLPHMQSLSLWRTRVTDAGLQKLKGLTNFRSLYLRGAKVTDAGVQCLKGLTELRALALDSRAVTDASMECLERMTRLEWLDLMGTQVTDAGLARLKGLTKLQFLGLGRTAVTHAGLEHLQRMTELQDLDLQHTEADDAGLEDLKGLSKLQRLYLLDTAVTDAGLEHLMGLTKLQFVDVEQTDVSEEGVRMLQEALPKCRIAATPGGAPGRAARRSSRSR